MPLKVADEGLKMEYELVCTHNCLYFEKRNLL